MFLLTGKAIAEKEYSSMEVEVEVIESGALSEPMETMEPEGIVETLLLKPVQPLEAKMDVEPVEVPDTEESMETGKRMEHMDFVQKKLTHRKMVQDWINIYFRSLNVSRR